MCQKNVLKLELILLHSGRSWIFTNFTFKMSTPIEGKRFEYKIWIVLTHLLQKGLFFVKAILQIIKKLGLLFSTSVSEMYLFYKVVIF